jgi:HEAT repeat protein
MSQSSSQGTEDDRIAALIAQLEAKEMQTREDAREKLVALGAPAVEPLAKLLDSSNTHLRWEAVKALEEIGSPEATPALLAALDDDVPEIRFMAGAALIAAGPSALEPLLKQLISHAHTGWLRGGAHHVLYHYANTELREIVHPVLEAM